MLKTKNIDREQLHLYTTSLMLKIASADDVIEESEINVILDILCDFYKISDYRAKELIAEAKKLMIILQISMKLDLSLIIPYH